MVKNWDNSYFDGLVVSKNITRSFKATLGEMHQGQLPKVFEANAGREQITVKSGTLQYRIEADSAWETYKAGDVFIIPKDARFFWKVPEGTMEYECVYLDTTAQ